MQNYTKIPNKKKNFVHFFAFYVIIVVFTRKISRNWYKNCRIKQKVNKKRITRNAPYGAFSVHSVYSIPCSKDTKRPAMLRDRHDRPQERECVL